MAYSAKEETGVAEEFVCFGDDGGGSEPLITRILANPLIIGFRRWGFGFVTNSR